MAKQQRSLYEGAPGILMDRIHEVEALLANSKIKTGENASWNFWKKTSEIMMYAWEYMQSLNWAIKELNQVRSENTYLRERCQRVEQENLIYRTIRTCLINGDLQEKTEIVKMMMDIGIEKMEGIYRD